MNQPDATAVDPDELIAAIRDFAQHTSEQIQRDRLRGDLLRVRLNAGEITCPYCQIQLVMDSALDTIIKTQEWPSCNRTFLIVNDPPVNRR